MKKGKTPSLISMGNGSIKFDTNTRSGPCSRCKEVLKNNQKIGLLKCIRGGYSSQKKLCIRCADEIISKTELDLRQIRSEIRSIEHLE